MLVKIVLVRVNFQIDKVIQVYVCHASHHVFGCFWKVIWRNNSVSTCLHANTFVLYQGTLCMMHISPLLVLLLKFMISNGLMQEYGAPLVTMLYIHVLYFNIILECILLNEIILYM